MAENSSQQSTEMALILPTFTDNTAWSARTYGAYCWLYNNAEENKDIYGALYNWWAVDTRKLCPLAGMHFRCEWTVLTTFIGGTVYAGRKLKEQVRFTGAVQDTRSYERDRLYSSSWWLPPGRFPNFGKVGYWWSATRESSSTAWGRWDGVQWPLYWKIRFCNNEWSIRSLSEDRIIRFHLR